jgi:hypothetical protein
MSGSRLEIEPHNWLRIDDLAGGCYPTIPHQGLSDAITINPVSTKSGAVHGQPPASLSRAARATPSRSAH